ncbi:MAG TPA: hypothetical protein VGE93_00020 [Bryobacteraceae bacterium]
MLKRLDKSLWLLPIGLFLLAEITLCGFYFANDSLLIAAIGPSTRKDLYSSLTGSSAALLGFVLAAVTILASFGLRDTKSAESHRREVRMTSARTIIVKCLLATAALLMLILICATVGLAIDVKKHGNIGLTSLTASASFGSLVGILVSGGGLTLAVMERNVNP